jgi:hypothetical protein
MINMSGGQVYLCYIRRQPTEATRTRQIELWGDLILAYHQHHHTTRCIVDQALVSPLCRNAAIQRK